VRIFPHRYILPRKLVILAIASKSNDDLVGVDKYADFQSRLGGGTLDLPLPEAVDRLYLTASLLLRLQQTVRRAERGLFDMVTDKDAHGVSTRDLEAFIASCAAPTDGILRRHHAKRPLSERLDIDRWRDSDDLITLVDSAARVSVP
jgi:hypothetical protein